MKGLAQIVILHPAAIGDAMLATPVPKALKANFPSAKITYWTHESLIPLLSMCPSIDAFVPYKRKQSLFGLSTTLKSLKPDLFINLTSAPKIKILSWFAAGQVAHYHKAKDGVEPIIHAVDNFLATVQSIVPSVPSSLFPTVEVSVDARASFYRAWKDRLGFDERSAQTIVALVPGVGNIRPNRAWNLNHWRDLALQLVEKRSHRVVLIGGTDEVEIGGQLSRLCQGKVLDLCGQLSLADTAVFLAECALTVSCDTGPAHISVAVGTPVVGLYGPTTSRRSGPFGCADLVVDNYDRCSCQYKKLCTAPRQNGAQALSGACLDEIALSDVLAKIDKALKLETIEKY